MKYFFLAHAVEIFDHSGDRVRRVFIGGQFFVSVYSYELTFSVPFSAGHGLMSIILLNYSELDYSSL
jgi:hypothetical protein